jgi:dihydrofolate reductase
MRKLSVFNHISLDGYFTDANGDMSCAHRDSNDAEWTSWVAENARGDSVLLFGRVTYELMASFWPTPLALETNRAVAERMNTLPKIVFSRSLTSASWANTTLIKGDIASAARDLKSQPGPDLVILGSGTNVSQLTDARLIDEYQVAVNPIALGAGRTMFEGVTKPVDLRLDRTRAFANGKVVLWYQRP